MRSCYCSLFFSSSLSTSSSRRTLLFIPASCLLGSSRHRYGRRSSGRVAFHLALWQRSALGSYGSAAKSVAGSVRRQEHESRVTSEVNCAALQGGTPETGGASPPSPCPSHPSQASLLYTNICTAKKRTSAFHKKIYYISDFSKINSSRHAEACMRTVTFFAIYNLYTGTSPPQRSSTSSRVHCIFSDNFQFPQRRSGWVCQRTANLSLLILTLPDSFSVDFS